MLLLFNHRYFLFSSAIICVLACLADSFIMIYIGNLIPGYNPYKQPMSFMGSSASPFGTFVSYWWIILGLLFILFSWGVYLFFGQENRAGVWIAILIALYAFGECIGSGESYRR